MTHRGSGCKSSATYFGIGITIAIMLSVMKPATSSELIREVDILPECQVYSQCDEMEVELESQNFTVLDSDTGLVQLTLRETCVSSLIVDRTAENRAEYKYLQYDCQMPESISSLECCQQNVTLQFLISGHYSIFNRTELISEYDIETNYSAEDLAEDCDFSVEHGETEERYTNIWMKLKEFNMNNVLKFYLSESGCKTPSDSDFWWKVEIKENQYENITVERNVLENGSVDCNIAEYQQYGELHCIIDWRRPSCLMIQREESNPIYYETPCQDVKRVTLEPKTYGRKPPYTSRAADVSATTSVLLLIVIPLIAAGIYFLMVMWYEDPGDYKKLEEGKFDYAISPYMKYKILLLYPQDCKEFMAAMKELKNVFENYKCFEIYDCFDPKRMEEIAPDPQGWISRLLAQKDVKIVVSETDTAVFHQTAGFEKCVVRYASPIPYNTLFTYALKTLLQSIRPQEYKRIFLFRFEDIQRDNVRLELAHYQRFMLPKHLNSLISRITNNDFITMGESQNSTSLKELTDTIEEYQKFVCSNPKYHETLFSNFRKLI